MQTGNDCLVCFLGQALATVRRSTTDPQQHWQLTGEVGKMLASFDPEIPSPENAVHYYRLIAQSINDATLEDAVACGLDRICPVIMVPMCPVPLWQSAAKNVVDTLQALTALSVKGWVISSVCVRGYVADLILFAVKCTTVLAPLAHRFPDAGLRIGSPVLLRG